MIVPAIASALAALAPAEVLTGCRAISAADVKSLFPIEAEAVCRAVATRRSEFATGRALLRELIGRDIPIPVGAGRRPDLPDGLVGSLAHTGTLAVAAVGPEDSVSAIGVDLEPATPLDAAMAAAILRQDEVDAHHNLDPHLAFTLKEAVYKAWSSLGGRLLDHHDVRLGVHFDDDRGGTFTALVDGADEYGGRWRLVAGHWLGLVAMNGVTRTVHIRPEADRTNDSPQAAGQVSRRGSTEDRSVAPSEAAVIVVGSGAARGAAIAACIPDTAVSVQDDLAEQPDRLAELAQLHRDARFVLVVCHPFAAPVERAKAREIEDAWVNVTGDLVDIAERIGRDRCLVLRAEDVEGGRTDELVAFVRGDAPDAAAPERTTVRAAGTPPGHRPSRSARALALDLGYDLESTIEAAHEDVADAVRGPAAQSGHDRRSTDVIRPATRGASVPASSGQQRLLFMNALEPGLSVHHLPSIRRLTGPIDVRAIEQAMNAVVARHEVLRTDFELRDGEWFQVVRPPAFLSLPYDDLRSVPEAERQAALAAAISAEVRKPFDLLHGPKTRGRLLRTADDEHILVVTLHHVAGDGSSMVQMTTDMSAFYAASVLGTEPALPPLTIQYADFTLWQRAFAESPEFAAQVEHWRRTLAGALPQLDLPGDRPRPAVFDHRSGSVDILFDAELTSRWRAAARARGVTPFMYLLASYAATLARWTGRDDIVVGIANANRRAETANLVGLFASTLPIRVGVDRTAPFAVLLDEVKRQTMGALANQDVPFDEIVRIVNPPRDRSRAPIFQTLFVLNNMRPPELSDVGDSSAEITVEKLATAPSGVELDLSVTVEESADGLFGRIDFASAMYDAATIERFVDHWRRLLEASTADPEVPSGALDILSTGERRAVAEEFASPGSMPPGLPGISRLDEIVGLRVLASPDATAFERGSDRLTYAEWDRAANGLARRLMHAGVEPGDRVGVATDRSTSMVVAVLAVLKCGAAYVPLDADLPAERLAYMIDNAGVTVAVVSGGALDHVGDAAGSLVTIDIAGADRAATDRTDERPISIDTSSASGGGAAWVIYTSGSTGRPKGVEVEHASAINFVSAMLDRPGVGEDDVVLAIPALSFDPSVLDLFVPALAGARVVIADRDDISDGRRLAALIESSRATIMQATPTTWSMLLNSGWTGSSRLKALCGGEAMTSELAGRLLGMCHSVWNLYGPTETTVWATAHEVTEASLVSTNVPVGRPIPNVVCRIVDDQDRLVPIGVPGEIVIGGVGLARGYVGRPDLTAAAFVVDPFDPSSTVYRTGDIGRWRADGELEHLGRRDFQIKLHGNRIELGEIEAALRETDGVADAVVVPVVEAGSTRLVAYLTAPPNGTIPSTADLRASLLQRLPRPMIPASFIGIEMLPLTPSGKIDRRALPDPVVAKSREAMSDGRPRDALEARLAGWFATVLGRDEVGIHDDFFELGGFSLIATRLFALIEADTGGHIPMATLFEASTVATLAEHVRTHHAANDEATDDQGRAVPHVVPIQRGGERTPFFCVHGAGGNVLIFRALSVALGPSQPFYGLQARGSDGLEQPHDSIEAMAEDYIPEIREVQPHGPYILGGYSGGGLVAYEIARRLVADGEDVALVVLLDTYPPVIPPTQNQVRDRLARLRREGREYLAHIVMRRIRAQLRARSLRRLDKIVASSQRVPVELRERFLDRAFFLAASKYVLRPYGGRVLLVRGETVPFSFRSLGSSYEWDDVVDPVENLTVVVTPGTHQTLLLGANVERVAAIVGDAIAGLEVHPTMS